MGHKSPWPNEVDVLAIRSNVIIEAVLFHRATRTVILTDLIENFEPKRIHSWFYRLLMKFSGVTDPDGKAPIDMQLSFFRRRKQLRENSIPIKRKIARILERTQGHAPR